jgi:hypothetical protein
MEQQQLGASKIVLPAPPPLVNAPPPWLEPIGITPPIVRPWAPAWFYSGLALLGMSYVAGDKSRQAFGFVLGGSDVDPYAELGSTRLFLITLTDSGFELTIAPAPGADAPLSGGTAYPRTDAGITAMYTALSATPAFAAAQFAYVAGADPQFVGATEVGPFVSTVRGGYDPASGLRSLVLGSAVAQAVPLDTFLVARNAQVYDPAPKIVPLFTSVVYDITANNALGDTTFTLPVVYTKDQLSAGTAYVNRMAGPTAIVPGGPGVPADDQPEIIAALTFSGSSPLAVFSQQTIAGFYKADGWTNTLGTPIWDFGTANAQFTATPGELAAPVTVFDPTASTLNGGSLAAVLSSLERADYLYSTDEVLAILAGARAAGSPDAGAALAATTVALGFDPSSSPAAPLVDQLSVPVTLDVTITPPVVALAAPPVTPRALAGPVDEVPIGIIANLPVSVPPAPVSLQLALEAFIPGEALAGTGISGLEPQTAFPAQDLGAWAAFAANPAGAVVNIAAIDDPKATPAPYDLNLSTLGLTLAPGTTYVAALNGTAVALRSPDGTTLTATVAGGAPDPAREYIGAFVATPGQATVPLYPKVPIQVPTPGPGVPGLQPGASYVVQLTYGATGSNYDITDSSGVPVATGVSAGSPQPSDGSEPAQGTLFFGTFTAGAAEMALWSVPVFLAVTPAAMVAAGAGTGTSGEISARAIVGGVPSYDLHVTDSSLFIFSNVNVDTGIAGSASTADVFLAGAVINSAPDDASAAAFTPNPLLPGIVRPVQLGPAQAYVFIPEADSVVIGGVRYLVSVIGLTALSTDPGSLPYPPAAWPQVRYWQFANRHNPYVGVRYTGKTQADREAQAQADIARIGLSLSAAQEPMHMYLDTDRTTMTIWPIYGFPLPAPSQSLDQVALSSLTQAVLEILADPSAFAPPGALPEGTITGLEQVNVPTDLLLENPFADSVGGTGGTGASGGSAGPASTAPAVGLPITNLNPAQANGSFPSSSAAYQSAMALAAQQAAATTSSAKNLIAMPQFTQEKDIEAAVPAAAAASRGPSEPIYGFSVYNQASGEAYLVEVVMADLTVPDRLPDPTQNADYDPYYVRVVFFSTMTCYSMTVIVPSIAYNQFGYFALEQTQYANVASKTDELGLGYSYGLYDSTDNFDSLRFTPYSPQAAQNATSSGTPETGSGQPVVFSNTPYATQQTAIYNPGSLFGSIAASLGTITFNEAAQDAAAQDAAAHDGHRPAAVGITKALSVAGSVVFREPSAPLPYFVCRRRNWSADCHLMQATNPPGTSVYLAFGAGDIVPLRLDVPVVPDKRLPTHMNQLSYPFTNAAYNAVQTISVANTPYVVALTTQNGVAQFMSFAIDPAAGAAGVQTSKPQPMTFPAECLIVGQATTTLTTIAEVNAKLNGTGYVTTGDFTGVDPDGNVTCQFAVIPYNNLVYLVRAVNNVPALGVIGDSTATSGLLIDTFVAKTTGNLALAQDARYKRSGLSYFGESYTPTTMVDSLDNLDFTGITGEIFYAPTIFVPIPELDATAGIVADISDFSGTQFWTFLYSEVVAQPGEQVYGVSYPDGLNLDGDGQPVLSIQQLQFVYDPVAVLFSPNDLTHKYALSAKQRVLALTNGQVLEGICWRSAAVQPDREAPRNVQAQQLIPDGPGMDAANIIYSPGNRPVTTPTTDGYLGMSVHRVRSLAAAVYNIEESAFPADQTAAGFVSAVSSNLNMVVGVLFDYDNNDLGTLNAYDPDLSTKGLVFLNGYLGPNGYAFSSPDHMDVNDVLPSQLPLLDQIADTLGWDVALYDTDMSLPRQYWSLSYDTLTAPGLPNFIADVPPAPADPGYLNRTRSLLLSLQNPVRPRELGLMDTYSSVVSANLTLENGVTGSLFLSKKADRNVASIGSHPGKSGTTYPLAGLPPNYDFFLFSRDHYDTLDGAQFLLIDHGYAMVLADDGTGTGAKVAKYYVDSDGNYFELYSYVLFSESAGVLETATFLLKVTLGSPASPNTTPPTPETPNSVSPQDLAAQINAASSLIYAAFGASSPGQPPAFLPIQVSGPGGAQAGTITGTPGFNGYALNVLGANRQPVQVSQIYSGAAAYPIAGTSVTVPVNPAKQKPVPFYGSISHGLDKQVSYPALYSAGGTSQIPRPTEPQTVTSGLFGGTGLGALIGAPLSFAFQGSGAIPPQVTGDPTPGTTMKADDSVFYTVNALTNATMDSTGKAGGLSGGQYFTDVTDPAAPIYGVVTLPKFSLNGNTYTVNLATTLPDGVTSRYTLVVGGRSYLFGPDNAHVTVDGTVLTFNPVSGGAYTVTYAAADAPAGAEAPSPIALTPFSVAAGSGTKTVDVFNDPGGLTDMVLGVTGRLYSYQPVAGTVIVAAGATRTTCPVRTGLVLTSATGYGYVVGVDDGQYTVNGSPAFPYNASTVGTPTSYPLMTKPQMFTIGGDFYAFDITPNGTYQSVTGSGQVVPVNQYQFSLNGQVYVIDTSVTPNTVTGNGVTYPMTDSNTQVVIDGAPYTLTLKQGSLLGATLAGQFDIVQGNVVVIEDYAYQLDTLNAQIVGNGTAYPLTTSGYTYSISTADQSFTVTTAPNATTVTIGGVDYAINGSTVVGDGVTYPMLVFRSFTDGAATFDIGLDGTVQTAKTFTLSGSAPYTGSTFTDGAATYTVNELAAFDGTTYYPMTGTPAAFMTPQGAFTVRGDGVAIAAGPAKTYLGGSGPLRPDSFTFGSETIWFGRPTDLAAFDGTRYYAIADGQFTDTTKGLTFTLSGNTAVSQGSSYEIFSNLGATPYFQVPGGSTYEVNLAVADTGSASGDVFSVFPASGGAFTMPVKYTLSVSGTEVSVASVTFTGGPVVVPTLTTAGGALTGGYFIDPVTGITYTVVVDGAVVTVIDSANTAHPYPAPGTTDTFVASVAVSTGVTIAVSGGANPQIYPVLNNQFITGTATYAVNVPIAYENAATGPYWPIVNGRFIVPGTPPLSSVAYTIGGGHVTKGYVLPTDDQFTADGKVTYTINAVNVVKADSGGVLTGTSGTETLTAGPHTYTLDQAGSRAATVVPGLSYDAAAATLTVAYAAGTVTYTVAGGKVTDNRKPQDTFPATTSGSVLSFTDTVTGVTFSFNPGGDNAVTAAFEYRSGFFTDVISGITYYVDVAAALVNAVSYLPETTAYGFTAANGVTYLVHYNDVDVVFPVISGAQVNVGVATVGADTFDVHADQVVPLGGGTPVPANPNSFEINGNLYSIVGTPNGADYSGCSVVGDGLAPVPFTSASTFRLTDPSVTYTLHLGADGLPSAVTASFPVRPSRDLISVADDVYLITYATTTSGSLLGQGQSAIPITNSAFTLANRLDSTRASFTFADLDIYDASSVVGQFTVYEAPTFTIGSVTYTLDTVNLVVRDASKRPYPLIADPAMFSVAGVNYVIDTDRVPHAIVGNATVSPLATDVTIENGKEVANSTFALGGQVYKYAEDATGHLLAVTGTRLYPIAASAMTFKLDSSLVFTLSMVPPAAGGYAGTDVPVGTVTAGALRLNVYAARPESANAPFFTYKNVLYTLVGSADAYVAVQKTYPVYASRPAASQQQLVVFDLGGTTCLVTDGTTRGAAAPAGINPGTLWAQTSVTTVETQFGLVTGLGGAPIPVTQEVLQSGAVRFQFPVTAPTGVGAATATTLYDIIYTPGSDANLVQVDVPASLPAFSQPSDFTFTAPAPLTLETGGYNAFTTLVSSANPPAQSFPRAFRTPVTSTDSMVDSLMTPQGDFSLEFWHSIPSSTPAAYHPVTFSASTSAMPVYYLDVDFEDASRIYIGINHAVMLASVAPPVFSSKWQHFALSYTQPYVMLCQGDGFEVQNGSNYNVARDFSIAFTFSAKDVTDPQGIVYKGAGSAIPTPDYLTSYRVTVENSTIALSFTDATGAAQKFTGPPGAVLSDNFYEVIIVKRTTTPLGRADSTDPYAPPFGSSDLGDAMANGASVNFTPPINSAGGSITVSNIQPAGTPTPTDDLIKALGTPQKMSYEVDFSIRTVYADGSSSAWVTSTSTPPQSTGSDPELNDPQLQVISTGSAHVLLGCAYDDGGQKMGLGSTANPGNLRDVYIFGSAIDTTGIQTPAGPVPIAQATAQQLQGASIAGYWKAAYDPDGIVANPVNTADVAISMNAATAILAPLADHELEGTALFVDGYPMTLSLVQGTAVPSSMTGYSGGSPVLRFEGGRYKLQEISLWRMARQQYQVINDMFGQLVAPNEPDLIIYLPGTFSAPLVVGPILPLARFIDQVQVTNEVQAMPLTFSPASFDLAGSPAVGTCGPLITPNLYTPPGVALTVCDAPPSLTTYSVTLNSVTGTLAGEINEAYAYIKDHVLMLYTGKKVGDLTLSWVTQQQGAVQVIGYVEGAPPAPMANLTNKTSYAGATSVTLNAPTSLTLKYQSQGQYDTNDDLKLTGDLAAAGGGGGGAGSAVNVTASASANAGAVAGAGAGAGGASAASATGADVEVRVNISPMGAGVHTPAAKVQLAGNAAVDFSWTSTSGQTGTASNKLDESNRYTVKLQGAMAPYTGDLFMASLNTLATPSTTPGLPASKSPILPDPNSGGFTTANPPGQLPKTAPTEEKFGSRMYVPSPYGQAFVTSATEDVYQLTLVQSQTVFGFVSVPNAQIPRDLNIVSFRMSSGYLRPGILDGFLAYAYKPATLPTGARTYTTSTGELEPVYDGNFDQGQVGHNASYMRVVEAYTLKRQIDQEAFTALAQYKTEYGKQADASDPVLIPALDFYNEYVWSSRGGTQEVKHTYTTTYDEVLLAGSTNGWSLSGTFDVKLDVFGSRVLTLGLGYTHGWKWTHRYSYNTTGTSSFDITASFDGIESDTQMRYASANDAHFVMKNNSTFNPGNQSGLNLVIGSEGLVYDIVPSVTSGAGIPVSDDLDTSFQYTQPQPSYATGNADGLTGSLVPYDRPGKTNLFRTLAFFLQPSGQNASDFWSTVIDPVWLANSTDPDAVALRQADQAASLPWRLLYRVTYAERFLPPVSAASISVPQITPLMAVPVLDSPADFLFHDPASKQPAPAKNPANDIEANVVLVAPTASGASAGTIQTAGPDEGLPVPPNNVIPFDLVKTAAGAAPVSWGDSANSKLLTQLLTSALGQATVPMTGVLPPGSTLVQSVADPVNGGTLYTTYTDPNGFTINVAANPAITVYQDVNGNPVSYYDGKEHHSLQADYVASADGTIMYYIQPPAGYDQSAFDLSGDYDLIGHPGDEWRYYLVSGFSADMTSDPTVAGSGPFLSSSGAGSSYTGFTIASAQHASSGENQVKGYVLIRGVLQWPSLNATAETFADLMIYKAMSLVDTFPIGDPEVLATFLMAQYPRSALTTNADITTVFARNIVSYFNATQQALLPQ